MGAPIHRVALYTGIMNVGCINTKFKHMAYAAPCLCFEWICREVLVREYLLYHIEKANTCIFVYIK